MVSRVQLPPEIQLAQRLAGNEQVTRDRAVRKLRKYIMARSQAAAGGFTHDELLKVWKGLFYCMWMQDKPLCQEELGRTIAQLVHAFQTPEAQHLFLQTFWQTMSREWTGIDRLRLDKFYMLMRMVLNESLEAVRAQGWHERHIKQLLDLLTTEILHPDSQAPNGVKNHFVEIFLEELTKVGAKELTAAQTLLFVEPFCGIAASTKDSLVLHNIARGVFETIVEQAPLAIEDLVNDLDTQEEEEEEEEEEDASDGDEALSEPELPSGGPPTGEEPTSCGDSGDGEGPVLQFDYEAVANRLFEVASQPSTPSLNRKRLYKVIRKLQDLAGGVFPEDDIPEEACRKLLESKRERKIKKMMRKKMRKKQKRPPPQSSALPQEGESERRKRSRRRGRGAGPLARSGERPTSRRQRDSSARKRKPRPQPPSGTPAKGAAVQEPRRKQRTLAGGK
ncbi:ribosomal RNA processing protein 1 homolog A [Ochotona princeps]|uniref:ribosomal RNA processing protein 1 homolog A n=1 Tax=Ochotona princeps TaxID=9978 RepID=UPI002714FF27|nr:ribosomal RNA processing protein 1 homolog A [Ochotona princeps]